MTDKPIIIPTIRIPALREGRMTQMRVPLDPQPTCRLPSGAVLVHEKDLPYSIGDRLWCRETWRPSRSAADPWHIAVLYPSDGHVKHWGWSSDADFGDWLMPKRAMAQNLSPVTMPRWASRTTLVVNDVRVQRVQEISEADAIAEGVNEVGSDFGVKTPHYQAYGQDACFGGLGGARMSFMTLWNTLHGPDAWDRNDWVCAISFDVHRCNIDQMPGDV